MQKRDGRGLQNLARRVQLPDRLRRSTGVSLDRARRGATVADTPSLRSVAMLEAYSEVRAELARLRNAAPECYAIGGES